MPYMVVLDRRGQGWIQGLSALTRPRTIVRHWIGGPGTHSMALYRSTGARQM